MMPMPLRGPTWFIFVWRKCEGHDHRHLFGVFSTEELCDTANTQVKGRPQVKKTLKVCIDLPTGYFPVDEVFEHLVDQEQLN